MKKIIILAFFLSLALSSNSSFQEKMVLKNAEALLGKNMGIKIVKTKYSSEFGDIYKMYINNLHNVKLIYVSKTGNFIPFIDPVTFTGKKNNPYKELHKLIEYESNLLGFKSLKNEMFVKIGNKEKENIYILVDPSCKNSKKAIETISEEDLKQYHFNIVITTLGEPLGIPSTSENIVKNILFNTELFYKEISKENKSKVKLEKLKLLFNNYSKKINQKDLNAVVTPKLSININQSILSLPQFQKLPVIIKEYNY
ncbi:hypothetical protein HOK00_06210 [bacterium]|nr:hypothetical protein [bacterium]